MALFKLVGKVQHYDWGGFEFIPNLVNIQNAQQKPFAEYWMGAHPKAPSTIEKNGDTVDLPAYISGAPVDVLGSDIAKKFAERLPFLFKVLDVKDMLSIQAHPTKAEAEIGFAKENEAGIPLSASHRNYKDDNHKPEMMVALTDFWLLHGFRPEEEIEKILNEVPELSSLMSVWKSGGYKGLYQHVMEMSQEDINSMLGSLADRVVELYLADKLDKDHPDFWAARTIANARATGDQNIDRGVFSIYFFNLVKAKKGDGIFQGAGMPHAYLEGVNIELMANSDNVLRGGLTPKHIDVPELLDKVIFEKTVPNILSGNDIGQGERVYPSSAPDFELSKIEVVKDNAYVKEGINSAEILLVTEGTVVIEDETAALTLSRGECAFTSAGSSYKISTVKRATLFKAYAPV